MSETPIHRCVNKGIKVCLYIRIMHNNKNKQTADWVDLKNVRLIKVKAR